MVYQSEDSELFRAGNHLLQMIPCGCQSSERRPRRGVAVVCVASAPTPTETKSPRVCGQMPPKLFCNALTPSGLPPFLRWGWLIPALFTGLAARPVDIPKRKKRRSVWCEHSERLCYNNSPFRVWLWLCHCRYILALCPRSVYHTFRGIVKGEYPFRITTAPPRVLLTTAQLGRSPISEQRKEGQQGKGGGAGARRGVRAFRGEADERRGDPPSDRPTPPRRPPHPKRTTTTAEETTAVFFKSPP